LNVYGTLPADHNHHPAAPSSSYDEKRHSAIHPSAILATEHLLHSVLPDAAIAIVHQVLLATLSAAIHPGDLLARDLSVHLFAAMLTLANPLANAIYPCAARDHANHFASHSKPCPAPRHQCKTLAKIWPLQITYLETVIPLLC